MAERLRQGERVGTGAMAEVYRGILAGERGVQKPVAIKRLRSDLRDDPRAVELFVNEASIAVRLAHPNVVQGLEFARDDDGYYLVCEWLDCFTLADIRERNGSLPWSAVVHIGRALCDALTHVHSLTDVDGTALEIVHRDVTPGNVFVTDGGRVKLGDFGVATCRKDTGAVEVREVGTPGFAAPEQSAGDWDARSDVFGVGATLASLATELPEPVAAVIDRARSDEPVNRYEDARALGRALAAAAAACDGGGVGGDEALDEIVAGFATAPSDNTPQLDIAVQSILGGALASSAPTPIAASPPPKRVRLSLVAGVGAFAALVLAIGSYAMREIPLDTSEAGQSVVDLNPHGAPAPLPSDPVPADPAPVDSTPPAEPARPAPPKALPKVVISINAVPWASVKIDGAPAGNTPLRKVALTVGAHTVTLVHPPDKTRRTFKIDVADQAGQTFVIDLRRGTVTKRTMAP